MMLNLEQKHTVQKDLGKAECSKCKHLLLLFSLMIACQFLLKFMRTLTGETKYLEREKQQGEKQDLRKKLRQKDRKQ